MDRSPVVGRSFSFVRVTDRVLHPAAFDRVIVPGFPDILDRLFGAPHEFHDSFRNIGNRLRRIPGDVFGRVEGALCRSQQRFFKLVCT
jgi:hypothetical protein